MKCYEKEIFLRTGQQAKTIAEPDTSNEWRRSNEIHLKHKMEMSMDTVEDFADDKNSSFRMKGAADVFS